MFKRSPRPTRDWIQTPVFAYGTLRHGERNYMRLLCGYTVSELPAEVDDMRLYSLGAFPVMIDAPGTGTVVQGELMILHPAQYPRLLTELDRLEGYNPSAEAEGAEPGLYRRVRRRIRLSGGAEAWAWLYVGNRAVLDRLPHSEISHGDWVRYQRERGRLTRYLKPVKAAQN